MLSSSMVFTTKRPTGPSFLPLVFHGEFVFKFFACDKLQIIQVPLMQNVNSQARKQLEKNLLPTSTSGKFRINLAQDRLIQRGIFWGHPWRDYHKASLSPNCSPMDGSATDPKIPSLRVVALNGGIFLWRALLKMQIHFLERVGDWPITHPLTSTAAGLTHNSPNK